MFKQSWIVLDLFQMIWGKKKIVYDEFENIEDLEQAVKISKLYFFLLSSGDVHKIEYMNMWVLQSSEYSSAIHIFHLPPKRTGDVEF